MLNRGRWSNKPLLHYSLILGSIQMKIKQIVNLVVKSTINIKYLNNVNILARNSIMRLVLRDFTGYCQKEIASIF